MKYQADFKRLDALIQLAATRALSPQEAIELQEEWAMLPFASLIDGEPVFILRAKDKCALPAVSRYADELGIRGLEDQRRDVDRVAGTMVNWQVRHMDATKYPD